MIHRSLLLLIAILLMSGLCFAQEGAVQIEMTNPGFEDGLAGWSIPHPDFTSVDTEVAHSGNASLRLSDAEGASNAYVAQAVRDLQGGATYTLRSWYRGEALGPRTTAAMKIEGYTAEGTNPLGKYVRQPLPETAGDWQLMELTVEFPPEVNRASLLVRLFGAGTVWFDDVTFERTEAAPPVVLGPERQVMQPDAGTISLTARLSAEFEGDRPPLEVSVSNQDGAAIASETSIEPAEEAMYTLTISLPELAPGQYTVTASLAGEDADSVMVFVPLQDRKPQNLTDTGTILVDGEPFFPIGVYHCSPSHYPMLAEAGFNAVQGKGPQNLEAFGAALDACEENGLMMDVPLYADGQVKANLEESLAGIEAYADHPAVLCWKIIDEPDIRPEITDEVPEVYAALKAADPVHPIELTLCQPPGFGYWANFCDIMQIDPYPIPRQPLTMVSDWVDTAMAGLEPWQNLTAVLQSGWIPEPMNQPTPEQARSMVYLALIHGAKGIFWYSFRDPGWRLEETPLWDAFPAINAELKELSMPVMVGEADEQVSVTSPDDVVHWRAWRYEGRTWLLMTNPLEEPVTATVDPGGECSVCDMHGEGLEQITDTFEVALPGYAAETRLLTR